MNDKSNLELEKKSEGQPLSYNPPNMSSEWEFNGSNLGNSSLGLVSNVNGMVVGGDGVGVGPSCSSNTMVDSFASAMWEHPVDAVALGFNEMNVHKGSMFIPNMSDIMPDSLSHFPADSAFIERAARFSSFSGGHFEELLNPFGIQQSVNPYLHAGTVMQGPREILSGNAMRMLPSRQPQNRDANVAQTSKDSSLPLDQRAVEEGSPLKETMVKRFHGDSKQGVSASGNDSDELQHSGGCTLEESTPLSAKGLGAKKRKRNCQDTEQANGIQLQSGEAGKEISETHRKGEQISAPTVSKSNGKQSSQNSDPPKGEYIHVRARRGQATNSHSLAERVRREKISERMKFLQDLVPGCSKVTGKAVMLDEIINYVQSLQRQVEFLSMKLATVNPRVEFNIDQLLAKDHMLSLQSGPSGMGISPSIPMGYPSLHPSQPAISHPGHPGIAKSSDLLRRTINSQLTNMGSYKKPTHQLPKAWDDELHNVVQMGFNVNDPLERQETNRPAAQGPLKHEP